MRGAAPYLRARMTRASSTEVRELESAASVRISGAGLARHQQDAAHRPMAGDAGAGNHFQSLPGHFERRHDADIGLARGQPVGASRRNLKFQIEQPLLGAVQHAPHQGSGVEITDRADAQPGMPGWDQRPV